MVVPIAMGLSKHHKFGIIIDDTKKDKDKKLPSFIAVQLGKECQQTYAFRDSRSDGNTILNELFWKLKDVKLIKINAVFQAYTTHTTRAFGMCKLELNVSELIYGDKFFVTLLEMQDLRCRMYQLYSDVHGKKSTTTFMIRVAH